MEYVAIVPYGAAGVKGRQESHGKSVMIAESPNPLPLPYAMRYWTSSEGRAEVCLLDVSGRVCRRLGGGRQPEGWHAIQWDGTDDFGKRLASGVYWLRVQAGSGVQEKRMVVLR
jgi:flagellar hook assembly protein FlgD